MKQTGLYRVYKYNKSISDLIRIAMFTKSMDEISVSNDHFNNEALHSSLFNIQLLSLEVELLINELQRDSDIPSADIVLQALHYAFDSSSLYNLSEIEQFKANYYKYVGYKTMKE